MRHALASITAALILSLAAAAHADPSATISASPGAPSMEEPTRKNGLHFDAGAALIGRYGLGYERVLSDHVSIEGTVSFFHASSAAGDMQLDATFVAVQPHVYLAQRAPAGFYVAPFVSVGRGAFRTDNDGDLRGTMISAGATFGYSLTISAFNLKTGLGWAHDYVTAQASDASGKTRSGWSAGDRLTADLSLGVVF